MTPVVRRSFAVACLLVSICSIVSSELLVDARALATEQETTRSPVVYTVQVDGIIHPVATAYIKRAIAEADAAKADLLGEWTPGLAGLDYERLLDRVRDRVGERRFAYGVQLIAGANDPLAIARGYSELAEAALQVLADATVAEFVAAHGRNCGGPVGHGNDLVLVEAPLELLLQPGVVLHDQQCRLVLSHSVLGVRPGMRCRRIGCLKQDDTRR